MSDKIPVELASMVGDYDGVDEIEQVPELVDKLSESEFWIFGARVWKGPIDYLKEHNYEIVGVDGNGNSVNQCRIWVRKQE